MHPSPATAILYKKSFVQSLSNVDPKISNKQKLKKKFILFNFQNKLHPLTPLIESIYALHIPQ